MPQVSRSELIPLPPQALWELMTDLSLRPRWDASVVSISREPGGDDPTATVLRYTAPLVFGLTWRWEGVYAAFDPPTRSAVRMVTGSALRPFKRLAGTWLLAPEDAATRLRLIVQFEARLPGLNGVQAWRVARLLDASLLRLHRLAAERAHTQGSA